MGWSFGKIMDDWFGFDQPDTSKADAAQAAALATQQEALKAQKDAALLAAAAAQPASDSESAVVASEGRKRKLQQGSSFGIGLQTQLGAPPVGFRLLSGQ
jgi:uncharacterized protein with LGFP repeats